MKLGSARLCPPIDVACGGRALTAAAPSPYHSWYKAVLARHVHDYDPLQDLEETSWDYDQEAHLSKHVPGYPSSFQLGNVGKWQELMSHIKQEGSRSYITNYAELKKYLDIYEADS